MTRKLHVNPDISRAETLPGWFYRDEELFEVSKQKIFSRSWHWVGDERLVPVTKSQYPFELYEGFLSEPLLLSRDEKDQIHCLTNICTHRANMLLDTPSRSSKISCMYHGRKFGLDGQFEFMPEFSDARDFPRECDHLKKFSVRNWQNHLFVGLEPSFDLQAVLDFMNERVGFLPLDQFKFSANQSKDYLVNAYWALYCDNYLEGFHIPFVHRDLNKVLDYSTYETVLHDRANLQIGFAENGTEIFSLPSDHIDHGKKVAGYYFWVFPNMMFNFYPWGLSINIVKPISIRQCKVSFLTYVYDETKLDKGAGALLDKVEREDEFVVEGVQKGINSNYYQAGRFSPTREQGVHHFHRLIAEFMNY